MDAKAIEKPVTQAVGDPLVIAGTAYPSRLILGSGKYPTLDLMRSALEVSEPAMVTIAVRRVDLTDRSETAFWSYLPKGLPILPNTAACYTAEDAIRTARLARELVGTDLIKLEVLGDPQSLFPDTEALLVATRTLVAEKFIVLPYTNDDPIVARKLVEAGAAAVMPLAAPIGSGQGVLNPLNIRLIRDIVRTVPVIVDAGVGTASDAAFAMELGIDGLLMNTAIAEATDPVLMAKAMRFATDAGRMAYLAGRMPKRQLAAPSSPVVGAVGGG